VNIFIPIKDQSERVPGKNHRDFYGSVPLWQYTIGRLLREVPEALIYIDTDSQRVLDIVLDMKVNGRQSDTIRLYAYRREPLHCGHKVPVNTLIERALWMFWPQYPEKVRLLQMHVTSPFWKADTLRKVYAAATEENSAMTVTRLQQRAWATTRSGLNVPMNHNPKELIPTQDLAPVFVENSVAYALVGKGFYEADANRVYGTPTFVECDQVESIDIDTESDWDFACRVQKAGL
jgi:CMP-N-acetylneuraminic acid synthetase